MPAAPNPSILLAHVAGLRKRAEGLTLRALHPFTRDRLDAITAATRDALAGLRDPELSGTRAQLDAIAETLRVQAERLDQLEDLLRQPGPPG
jgi:hypothetical protein